MTNNKRQQNVSFQNNQEGQIQDRDLVRNIVKEY